MTLPLVAILSSGWLPRRGSSSAGSRVAFGSVCIYSPQPNAFTPEEIRLLEELAGDLAFGISALRSQAEHLRTERALRESEERLRLAQTTAKIGIFDVDLVRDHATYDAGRWTRQA